MDGQQQIIEDVIAALKLARELRHRPLIDSLLESTRQALESTLAKEAPAEPVKVTGTKYRYVNFIADITPYLKSLYPGRPQKVNFSEAAKLWKAHKHLDDYDKILAAAAAEAASTDICPESLTSQQN
jgi:hypothetical protein